MNDEIKSKIEKMTEWSTSNQGLVKRGWKILKVYDKKSSTSNKVTKYALIECIFCKTQKLVLYYNFIKNDNILLCSCNEYRAKKASELIGKTIGHYNILDFCEVKKSKNNSYAYYYDVQCVKCGSIRKHVLYNRNSWEDYYQGCPDCSRVKLSYYERRFKEYQQSAKVRNLEWSLTFEQFCDLISKNCVYCNSKPENHFRSIGQKKTISEGVMNGIDRVDSSKGYTIDNCVSCCSKCNYMKNDLSKDTFLDHITKIYLFTKQGSTTIENTSNDGSE